MKQSLSEYKLLKTQTINACDWTWAGMKPAGEFQGYSCGYMTSAF
jgi:hypothetical protein